MIANDKLIKAYEGKPARELLSAPISALQGVSENDAVRMKEAFGIDNIQEMAELKFFRRAQTILREANGGSEDK